MDELEMYKELVKEQKRDIKTLMDCIRGFDVKVKEDDVMIRFSGDTVYLMEAQKVLLENALEVIEKYK